jgi:hypothetical protein
MEHFKLKQELTFQFFGKLSDLLLVVVIGPSGTLQAEFPGSDFIQPFHHLVF